MDPDPRSAGQLVTRFGTEGIPIRWVATASELEVSAGWPDVVIASAVGEGILDTCRALRASRPHLGIIVLVATGEEEERVAAFEAGADDVVPAIGLSLRELVLRARAVARRPTASAAPATTRVLRAGPLCVDDASVTVDGKSVLVSPLEREFLQALLERPGRVLDRQTLIKSVWGGERVDPRTVDTVVKRLRARLGPTGNLILTVRGVGYRLDAS